ncbi:AAA family ATPase [Elizabethkingia anophelis]|uniref:AAA family ATPase n=1 Tax=Elizabethkingia anophelis TaxID=1117645 RepID=UPI0023E99B0F|nr:AAA family ATPase [Elizabethkingia anophelis]GJN62051.1 hypothetical protein ELAK_22010 [Elizabethkingia anophelis]HDP3253299.1 AAA family ATPase [Elizabethkingia anophelis]
MSEIMYLRNAKLSGYKSIHNTDVEFNKDINIIIGKNAVGKTNFLSFLNKTLVFDFKGLTNFESILTFESKVAIKISAKRNIEMKNIIENFNIVDVNSKIRIGNKTIKLRNEDKYSILLENNIKYNSTFICHGIPKKLPIISTPLDFKFEIEKLSIDILDVYSNEDSPFFLRTIALELLFNSMQIKALDEDLIKNQYNALFEKFYEINSVLKKYSPIQEIRFSDNYNVFFNDSNEITISNLFIEYKIDGQWLSFANLSDGTKRLFFIISEIFDSYNSLERSFVFSGLIVGRQDVCRIILLEEPELGIHPHQFHKLMEFIKLESKSKQIIITTHSPQALDSLSENELDRIILAYTSANNSTKGTQFRRLNENELHKAKEYIDENFLSDYWLYSDLEK